jgi:hypothetical protein
MHHQPQALKKYTMLYKKLKAAHPRMAHQSLVKKASAEYQKTKKTTKKTITKKTITKKTILIPYSKKVCYHY